MKRLILFISTLVILSGCSNVKKNERYYQERLCDKLDGVIEYTLKDKTRVDCLTDEYAIEVDWAKKWAEGVGQSLYYAHMTERKPAIGLIVNSKDSRYIKRVNKLAKEFDIKIFIIHK